MVLGLFADSNYNSDGLTTLSQNITSFSGWNTTLNYLQQINSNGGAICYGTSLSCTPGYTNSTFTNINAS